MERKKIIKINYPTVFLYIIFSVGIAGHLIKQTQNIMLLLTPFTLLITGAVVLYVSAQDKSEKLLIWAVITYITTFILEALGVATAQIFGNYKYGNTLGLSFFNVPLIIGFNWVLVILGSISVSKRISKNIYSGSFLAAILAVIFDYVLEPIAIRLNYWQWDNDIIPIQNYIAWFIIAFISALIFFKLNANTNSKISIHYFFVQLIFFITLSIFMV
jgi:putative membrane protein